MLPQHEISLRIQHQNSSEPVPYILHLVFSKNLPVRIYGYGMTPPEKSLLEQTIEDWYGFRVKLSPFRYQELERPVWEAKISLKKENRKSPRASQ